MKLSTQQLTEFAVGIDHVEPFEGGIRLFRFPVNFEAIYRGNEVHSLRRQCTPCVRLRFATDSKWIRMRLKFGEPVRWYFASAIEVDGDRADAFGPISRQEIWEGVAFSQPQRARHVYDIWLPHMCRADVLGIEVEDGCVVESAPALKFKWLAYGDSITQGATASIPVFTWTARMARQLRANVINFGVGGATLQEKELADSVPNQPADLVTISYGANDFSANVTKAQIHEYAAALAESLKKHTVPERIVITTPTPHFRAIGPNGGGATFDDLRAGLESAARETGVVSIAGPDLLSEDRAYFNDWVHPNDSGHQIIAKNLIAALNRTGIALPTTR